MTFYDLWVIVSFPERLRTIYKEGRNTYGTRGVLRACLTGKAESLAADVGQADERG